jgi:hypothetical protein
MFFLLISQHNQQVFNEPILNLILKYNIYCFMNNIDLSDKLNFQKYLV